MRFATYTGKDVKLIPCVDWDAGPGWDVVVGVAGVIVVPD